MSDKTTRGRASKVDLLPPDIKTRLAMMLRDKMFSQAEILEEINDLIRDCGLPENALLSKTGLNRYASRMEKMGAKIRESREMAEVWTKQLGEAPQSDVGKLLMEAVKTIAFDKAMALGQLDDVDPKVINQLALVANRIEQAQAINEKRERDIRKEVAQLAADTAEAVVMQAGLSQDTVDRLKEKILGIA
ncbi:hypothetical protein A6046_03320 [[Haemophilus] ducreyi]|uniref:Mu-like phage gp27 n=2 Tax=Haemophilus ducreyi TaxID=730 RepID=Q7VPF8_HAEDU|nr:DUF3486 family protein [[Haemophilus] ducreyi]AAP95123.1 Mu-like phage gp27 [[Haemophilus] ducreyi 35000HP]AKO30297.1 Mu-like prophage FluMu protein gp27 [[Haemophilus] ducreyi]AKO31730.1 Mu-like prophage FluMu protein gp27 [[Haemophilus] ducreyi]AKO33183.1 Mu-like prophage FluMu protein gp27 [[Haemophilus] ducreyi]AKO34632.1 Mu-like prophage FluMu protein gp27 [[Haemophilus] ducreyi]